MASALLGAHGYAGHAVSGFLSQLQMAPASDRDDGFWILLSDLVYASDVANRIITVPKGFQTNLASVPRVPFIYELVGNTSSKAAVVHDWLYSSYEVPRVMADRILNEASAATGVPAWRRWVMWAGVRLGGGAYWKEPPARSVEELKRGV